MVSSSLNTRRAVDTLYRIERNSRLGVYLIPFNLFVVEFFTQHRRTMHRLGFDGGELGAGVLNTVGKFLNRQFGLQVFSDETRVFTKKFLSRNV